MRIRNKQLNDHRSAPALLHIRGYIHTPCECIGKGKRERKLNVCEFWLLTIKSMLLFHLKGLMNVAVDGKSALLAINVPGHEVKKHWMRYIGWKTNKPTILWFFFSSTELVDILALPLSLFWPLFQCVNDIRHEHERVWCVCVYAISKNRRFIFSH